MEGTRGFQQRYDELIKEYRTLQVNYSEQAKLYSRKIIKTGWIRVLLFVLLIALPLYFYHTSIYLSLLGFFVIATGFVVVIKKFNHYKNLKEENRHLQNLNQNEVSAINGDWDCFCSGKKFIDPFHNYSHDLDLFGEGSFYQYINRCATIEGESVLWQKLANAKPDIDSIRKNQKLFQELSQKLSFRQSFYAKGKCMDEQESDLENLRDLESYSPWLKNKGIAFRFLVKLLPFLFIISLVISIMGYLQELPVLLFIVNLNVLGLNFRTLTKLNNRFSVLSGMLKKYSVLTDLVAKQRFVSDGLVDLSDRLVSKESNASVAI